MATLRYYTQPLRRIFAALQRRDLLSDVQTLVLDGMSVTAELCNEIITDPTYNVRLLSIRGAKNLNEHKLRAALKYACRPTRPTGMPKLKGLYLFTDPSRDASEDPWYDVKGKIIHQQVPSEWADTLVDCQGIIAFDAVLCAGPRHLNSPAADMIASPGPPWAVATVALPGCAGCGTAPEGTTVFHPSADRTRLPLLPGAPLQSSSLKAATCPELETPSFIARCAPCLDDRRCATCEVWWCEACYTVPFFAVAAFENGAKKVRNTLTLFASLAAPPAAPSDARNQRLATGRRDPLKAWSRSVPWRRQSYLFFFLLLSRTRAHITTVLDPPELR